MLDGPPQKQVFLDRSVEMLWKAAERTSDFLDIPHIVGMIDGDKISTRSPQETNAQNRDYNGWKRMSTVMLF